MTYLRFVIPLQPIVEHDIFRKPGPTFRDHALMELGARSSLAMGSCVRRPTLCAISPRFWSPTYVASVTAGSCPHQGWMFEKGWPFRRDSTKRTDRSLPGIWSLRPVGRTSSAFKRQFDCPGHCNALLSWHGNHAPVSSSAIARSELIAAFAGLTRIRIKVGAAIHTIRLRFGRSLGVRLSGVRQGRHQTTHREAGNQPHSDLPLVMDICHYNDGLTILVR
jgi:hypothetical protein